MQDFFLQAEKAWKIGIPVLVLNLVFGIGFAHALKAMGGLEPIVQAALVLAQVLGGLIIGGDHIIARDISKVGRIMAVDNDDAPKTELPNFAK